MSEQVTIVGRRIDPDEVTLVVDDKEFGGWQAVRITRGIERMPSDFELIATEVYPAALQALVINPGQSCEVWIGRERVITGYVNRYSPSLAPRQHAVRITGRGRCQDLVDCAAEWPGSQIVAASVLEVARKLAAVYDIDVNGEAGPAVGQGGATLIPQLNLMLGETPWEIIDRLCRIAGLLAYEQPDGSLCLAVGPGDGLASRAVANVARSASGFSEGVNVTRASAEFSDDQRFSAYKAYRFSFDAFTDLSQAGNLIGEAVDPGVSRHRVRVIIAEMGHALGVQNAQDRAAWEASRRLGRSRAVHITTDSWRDAAGSLYRPNTLAAVDLPSLRVAGVMWLISDVTYRKGPEGTQCDLVLMPPQAFSVQPTLPAQVIPADVAGLPNNLGRP